VAAPLPPQRSTDSIVGTESDDQNAANFDFAKVRGAFYHNRRSPVSRISLDG
jgi:hypothetical protein